MCDSTLPKKAARSICSAFGGSARDWNVADPPTQLLAQLDGLKDTHKSWWECDTGISCQAPDWRASATQVYDLSIPAIR